MKNLLLLLMVAVTFVSCRNHSDNNKANSNIAYSTDTTSAALETIQADWTKDATIYEVNVRQFSKEGTLDAVTAQLERIKSMGIDIIWVMPVFPISKVKRKEGPEDLGSYYAVADFRQINPDYGTMEDMDELIARAHELDMKLILDWVPNHTGWDHHWIVDHPDYYTQVDGEIVDPLNPETGQSWGWTDVADLNYDNPHLRRAMIDEMKYWVKEKKIDGFRCDVAHGVPLDFWEKAIPELKEASVEGDLFMLAEAESPELAGWFNMSYSWHFHHTLKDVVQGKEPKSVIRESVEDFHTRFGSNHYAMMFTTNHDENSWAGTVFERYGDAHKAMAVLTFTIDGMPLVYSGQEAGLDKRLAFFKKDVIDWKDYPLQDFYSNLLEIKKNNKALWNGDFGGDFTILQEGEDDPIYLFERTNDENSVMVAINFSDEKATFVWPHDSREGWSLILGEDEQTEENVGLIPFGYAVWAKSE